MTDKRMTVKAFIAWSKAVFTPLALAFLGYFFWINRDTLLSIYSEGSLINFSLVVICWMVLHMISPMFTRLALESLGVSMDYKTALRIHISRLPAKYLPGGIWHSVARAADYRVAGMDSGTIVRYLILENVVIVAVALGIGSIFALRANSSSYVAFVMAAVMVMSWVLLLLLPRLSRLGAGPGQFSSGPAYLRSILVIAGYWCLAAVSFSLFIMAFPGLHVSVSPWITGGIYLFSWGVGYLAVFAPQGLGVAEVVSGLLLGSDIDLASMIIVLLGFRILMAVADIACWMIYSLVDRRTRT